MVLAPRGADAYSVLAHESNIDALWNSHIRPVLLARYPGTSADGLLEARAYAYGGSTIQDLGYFPFGSRFFTNLLHYVKTGDFVQALLRDAHDVDELAFALGALCHYASDTEGHAIAVNRAVPLMYPKLRAKYGDRVPYDEAPKEHILVEFAFDVLLVAHGGYKLQAYHDFIGFKVSKPLLERAFTETYGLEMKDVFVNEDLGNRHLPPRGGLHDSQRDEGGLGEEARSDSADDARRRARRVRAGAAAHRVREGVRKGLQEAELLRADDRRALFDPAENRALPSAVVQGPAA